MKNNSVQLKKLLLLIGLLVLCAPQGLKAATLLQPKNYLLHGTKFNVSSTQRFTNGLVGYWTLDGATTPWTSSTAATTYDKGPYGNTGTLTNMNRSTSPTIGKIGQAMNFDGSNDYIDIISNATSSSQTTVRSSSSGTGTNTGTVVSVSAPAGTTAGDVVIVFTEVNGQTTETDNNGSTPFTQDLTNYKPNATAGQTISVFSRRIQAGDPTTYNFTAGLSNQRWTAVAITLQNPDASTVYDVSPTGGDHDDGGGAIAGQTVSITTNTANAIHFAVMAPDGPSNTCTSSPSGYTLEKNVGNEALCVAYKVITSPSATGVQTFGWGNADAYLGVSLAIKDKNASNQTSLDFENTEPFSYSLWLKPDRTNTAIQLPFGKQSGDSPYTGWDMQINDANNVNTAGMITIELVSSTVTTNELVVHTTSVTNLNNGDWHHYTVTYDGSSSPSGLKVYEDGVSLGLTTDINGLTGSIRASGNVRIGARNGSSSLPYDGLVDDVRVYNRVLSATEVKALYQSGVTKVNSSQNSRSTSGLVGLWSFNGADMSKAISFTDNFNRSNSASLGSSWTDLSTAFKISSNAAAPTTLGNDSDAYYSAAGFSGDQYSQAKITVGGVGSGLGSGAGVMVRTSSTNGNRNEYHLVADHATSNNVSLGKFVNGTYAEIWHTTQSFTDGDTFRLEVVGSTLRAYLNGTQIGNDTTDTSLSSGSPGIRYSSTETSASIDDWQGGSLSYTAYDRSGSGNNLVAISTSSAMTVTIGKVGQGFKFDGSQSTFGISSPSSALSLANSWTVSAWVKLKSLPSADTSHHIVDKYTGSGNNYDLLVDNAHIAAGTGFAIVFNSTGCCDNRYAKGATTPVVDQWYHVTGVYDYTTENLYLYVNGVLDGSSSVAGFRPETTNSTLYVGSLLGTSPFLNGSVDEIRIYNRALSASEIKQLYLMGK